tara:strand:- start:3038 stop:3247 length:210 start_codon:yes stop_codon:yes gene_type:complete
MTTNATYRLVNQKNKGYKGLYAKLFRLLNKDSIFAECFEESMSYDGNDVIIITTWAYEGILPKGIIQLN